MRPLLILATTFGVYLIATGKMSKYLELATSKAAPPVIEPAANTGKPPVVGSSPSTTGGASKGGVSAKMDELLKELAF